MGKIQKVGPWFRAAGVRVNVVQGLKGRVWLFAEDSQTFGALIGFRALNSWSMFFAGAFEAYSKA